MTDFILCFALISVTATISRLLLGYNSNKWPSTIGTVLEQKINTNEYAGKFESMHDGPVKHSYLDIKYKYVANGKEYISSRITFGLVDEENENCIETNDDKIAVYYFSKYPALSVLKPGAAQVGLYLTVQVVILIILSVTWVLCRK